MSDAFTDNSSDQIVAAAASSINNFDAMTAVLWIIFDTLPGSGVARRIFRKDGNGSITGRLLTLDNTAGTVRIISGNGRATTSAQAIATGTALTGGVFATGVWYFLAATYDSTDGPRLWGGKLGTQLVEATSYVTRTSGSGAANADSSNPLEIGLSGSQPSFGGSLGTFAYMGSRLVLAELQALQYRPRNAVRYTSASGLVYENVFPTALGNTPDLSLNGNSGAKTGIVGNDHVPLGPRFQ